jgi:hypothetical protein
MSRENRFALASILIAIACAVGQIMHPLIPPALGWPIVGILVISAILLLITGIRKKEGQKESLIPTIDFHAYGFGLSGYRGYPKEPDESWWLNLEISIDRINRPIDTLDLVIEGEYIPVNLPCKFSHIFHGYFKVSKWRHTGEHQIELIAKAGNEPISSGRKSIDFNMEPFGKHQT